MTNATKALIITAVNAVLGLVVSFGVALSDAQRGAIVTTVNAVLAVAVALTYKNSSRRIPDPPPLAPASPPETKTGP